MFRFLHIADVHLDTTFLCRTDALRTRLRTALREAFRRAVDCAIDEDVHAVLIAGDLFDSARLSFATERFLTEELCRLDEAGIRCVYASGNHDPGGRAHRGGNIEWPASFHYITSGEPAHFVIPNGDGTAVGTVVAAGHSTARESENLARAFPIAEGDLPHVGLLHTYVTSADEAECHNRYAPSSLEDLRRPGYRYWALGHVHRRQQVCEVTEAWYPGNLQGRNPRETGPKGGLLVTINGTEPPQVEFRPFANVQWLEVRVDDLADAHTLSELESRICSAYQEQPPEGAVDCILRVELSGPSPLAEELRSEEERRDLEDLLVSRLDLLDVDLRVRGVTPSIDVDSHRGEPHLLGAVLDLLEDAKRDPEVLRRVAPEIVANSLQDPDAEVAYLQELLKGLDAEAAARIVRPD